MGTKFKISFAVFCSCIGTQLSSKCPTRVLNYDLRDGYFDKIYLSLSMNSYLCATH